MIRGDYMSMMEVVEAMKSQINKQPQRELMKPNKETSGEGFEEILQEEIRKLREEAQGTK